MLNVIAIDERPPTLRLKVSRALTMEDPHAGLWARMGVSFERDGYATAVSSWPILLPILLPPTILLPKPIVNWQPICSWGNKVGERATALDNCTRSACATPVCGTLTGVASTSASAGL